MQRPLASPLVRRAIAGWVCAAFLAGLALSVVPQWHERLHPNAKDPQHECAVTLIASGNYQHTTAAPLVVAPAPALQFSFIPALHPVWVASPFIGARIFEHAPPARA